jgi:hypothetical protein
MQPVYKQQVGKHVPVDRNTGATTEEQYFLYGSHGGVILKKIKLSSSKNIRGLNLAVVKFTTFQVAKLPL